MNSSVNCNENLSRDSLTEEYWNTAMMSGVHRAMGITTGTIMLLFFLLGVPGNGLIIFSILRHHLYKQPTLLLLLNLAVADFLACLIVIPPISVTGIAGEFIFGGSDYVRCKVCQAGIIIVLLSLVNLYMLALLSVDRFILIKYPLKYSKIVTLKATVVAILLTWLTSIFISLLPSVFNFGAVYYDHPTFTCTPQFDGSTEVTLNIYYAVVILLVSVLPFSCLVVTNMWILVIAKRQIKQVYSMHKSTDKKYWLEYSTSIRKRMKNEKNKKQLQLLRVFGLILISNIITWIPLIIRIIEASIRTSDNQALWSNFILIVSINSHCIIHPFLQASLIPEIRQYLLLPCQMCRLCHRTKGTIMKCKTKKICIKCELNAFQRCLEVLNMNLLPPSDTVLPPSDIVLPLSDAVLPSNDAVLPSTDAVLPSCDFALPSCDAVLPPTDTGLLSSDAIFPPSDSVTTK